MCEEQNKVENNSANIFKEKIITTMVSHPVAVTAAACGVFVIGTYCITKHCITRAIYDANKKTIQYLSKARSF